MTLHNFYSNVVIVLRTYPAVTLMLLNIGVILAAHLGYHVTTDQLATISVEAATIAGIITHNAVTPNVRVNPPEAKGKII